MTSRSEGLTVFVRVRPPIYKEVKEETAVHVRGVQSLTVTSESKETSCSYDHVFNEVSEQGHVFEKVKPLLVDVLSGINSCIFAYGQTSAGKSYTMIGPNGGQDVLRCDKNDWGILPRASEFLLGYLNEKSKEGHLSYEVKASFLQIYNENLYDLLRDSGPMMENRMINNGEQDEELKIREIPPVRGKGGKIGLEPEVYVSGLSEFRVQTSDDILRILAVGTTNRMTRSTDFNFTSSRSHAILQLTFSIESHTSSGQTMISKSKLNLVDLAGSEKIPYATSDTNNQKHMKELTSINKSLSCLGNVISALTSSNRSHIPYRDSKLTRILQDSLSGNTRTILIACVAPTVLHTSESFSTLQFADRAKNVMLSVKPNTLVDDKVLLAKAQSEIARLKALLTHALKQLEQKSNSENNNGGEIERLLNENEDLRRENASLLKRCMVNDAHHALENKLESNSVHSYESRERGRGPSRSRRDSAGAGRRDSASASRDRDVMATPGGSSKKKGSVPPIRDNSRLLDTKVLESRIKKTEYQAFSDFSGPTSSQSRRGKKKKAALSPGQAFGRHLDPLKRNRSTDSQDAPPADPDYDDVPPRSKGGKKNRSRQPNSDGHYDVLDSYNRESDRDREKDSRMRNNLYKAINDRQTEELNLRLAQANMKLVEEDLRYREETDIESSINSLLGLNRKPSRQKKPPAVPVIVEEPESPVRNPVPPAELFSPDRNSSTYNNTPFVGNNGVNNSNAYNTAIANSSSTSGPPSANTNSYRANNTLSINTNIVSPVGAGQPGSNEQNKPPVQVVELNEKNLISLNYQNNNALANNNRSNAGNAHVGHSVNSHNNNVNIGLLPSASSRNDTGFAPIQSSYTMGLSSPSPPLNHQVSTIGFSPGPAYDSSRILAPIGGFGAGPIGTGLAPIPQLPHSAGSGVSGVTSASRMDPYAPSNRIILKNKAANQAPQGRHTDEHSAYMSPAGKNQGQGHHKLYNGHHHHFPTAGVAPPMKAAAHTAGILAMAMSQMQHQAESNRFGGPGDYQRNNDFQMGSQNNRAVSLSYTKSDVGTAIQMFSFRQNTWDRVDIVDYDENKRLHKCKYHDGTMQWLELSKKPIREYQP